jgi:hypothetical protein
MADQEHAATKFPAPEYHRACFDLAALTEHGKSAHRRPQPDAATVRYCRARGAGRGMVFGSDWPCIP